MSKKSISIALAYVGVIVGAGFASGREIVQYFVSFGLDGLWGLAIAAVIFIGTGNVILGFGSYYLADSHFEVLDEITSPLVSKILDVIFMVTCFTVGFVMIAGAGSNLNQQFGLPNWVGALLMSILVILAGMVDTDKITNIIGSITPFLIVFVLGASIFALITTDIDIAASDQAARNLPTTLPNIWVSAINYVTFSLVTGTSMALVMSGDSANTKAARQGGMLGGAIISLLLAVSSMAMFVQIETVGHLEMPILEMVNQIHPFLGTLMTFVILGMIFNTALGLFYALSSRLSKGHGSKFKRNYIILVVIGFIASFVGFSELVAVLYPILGYGGILLLIVLVYGWVKKRRIVYREEKRRQNIRRFINKKHNPSQTFDKQDSKKLEALLDESNIDSYELRTNIRRSSKFYKDKE